MSKCGILKIYHILIYQSQKISWKYNIICIALIFDNFTIKFILGNSLKIVLGQWNDKQNKFHVNMRCNCTYLAMKSNRYGIIDEIFSGNDTIIEISNTYTLDLNTIEIAGLIINQFKSCARPNNSKLMLPTIFIMVYQ